MAGRRRRLGRNSSRAGSVSLVLHAERLSDSLMTCGVVALTMLVILGSIAIAGAGALWIWAFDPAYRLSYRARSASTRESGVIIAAVPADQVLGLTNRATPSSQARSSQVVGS